MARFEEVLIGSGDISAATIIGKDDRVLDAMVVIEGDA